MLGNSDLKDEQNAIYTLDGAVRRRDALVRRARSRADVRPHRRHRRAARRHRGLRADAVHQRRRQRHVRFDYRGRHGALFDDITPADVRWICERLHALTDAQWHDAFRAGGYSEADRRRFIRRLKQKIAEGWR